MNEGLVWSRAGGSQLRAGPADEDEPPTEKMSRLRPAQDITVKGPHVPSPSAVLDGAEGEAGVDAAEAEGVAEEVLGLRLAAVGWDHVEVAGGVLVEQVGGAG